MADRSVLHLADPRPPAASPNPGCRPGDSAVDERATHMHDLALLGEMTAGLVHDIRNPLAALMLYAEQLMEEMQAEAGSGDALCRKILYAASRIESMAQDVLSFAGTGSARVQWEPIDADRFLETARHECVGMFSDAGVRLISAVSAAGEMQLQADKGLLLRALGNLLRNAVESMARCDPSSRLVFMSCTPGVSWGARRNRVPGALLAVEDAGPGIPVAMRERIFDPFYSTRQGGTGLGLAIVLRIMDVHGGQVRVVDSSLGGSRFELHIPCPASREVDN